MIDKLRSLIPPSADEQLAERMGYSAAVDGPDTVNCSFHLFTSPALTKAWERGNKRGLEEKARAKP